VADEGEWELTPESVHPAARALLADAFFWDCVDENSPFGNDTGADVLALFHGWRAEHQDASALAFLSGLLEGWEVTDAHWDVQDEGEVAHLLKEDAFSFTHRDDSIVALAFAQLALDGRVEAEVRERALAALHRQSLGPALDQWSREHRQERLLRLASMQRALREA
jgi:uncharacterized protein YfeS